VSSVAYWCLWVLARIIARLCFRYRVWGRVPRSGGLVIAANHASYVDIPLLGCGITRRAWYLGRSDLFPIPGLNRVLQWLGWVPLRPGRLDRKAFEKAMRLIKEGKVVVIFPEGGRTLDGHLRPAKPGLGIIVAQTGCPVVPAHLEGTYEVLRAGARRPRFYPVILRIGEPMLFATPDTKEGLKTFYEEVSRTVMDRIATLGGVASPTHRQPAGTRNAE
jgi:1-acyl-sn-glycerol-3-phosphate acyltransferase